MDPQIVTLIVGLAIPVVTILSYIVGKRERRASAQASEASAAAFLSEGYKKLVDSLEERVNHLEEERDKEKEEHRIELARLKLENKELRVENAKLKLTIEEQNARIEALEHWKNNQPRLPGLTENDPQ